MEEVDLVIVGAEGVAESGGIINKVTYYLVTSLRPDYIEMHVAQYRLVPIRWLSWQRHSISHSM